MVEAEAALRSTGTIDDGLREICRSIDQGTWVSWNWVAHDLPRGFCGQFFTPSSALLLFLDECPFWVAKSSQSTADRDDDDADDVGDIQGHAAPR